MHDTNVKPALSSNVAREIFPW